MPSNDHLETLLLAFTNVKLSYPLEALKGVEVSQKKLFLVNLCLTCIVCVLVLKVYSIWNNTYALPTSLTKQAGVKAHTPKHRTRAKARKANGNYDIIVEKNLFFRNRSCREETESLISASQMVLHGTFIFGEHKAALLELQAKEQKKVRRGKNPNKAADNKESRQVGVGDTIAGYQVANILEDKVVLKDGAGKACVVQIEIPKDRSHIRTEVSKSRKKTRTPRRSSSRATSSRSRRARR